MGRKLSAGILLYRIRDRELQVLVAHMGGPFWERKDEGAWSIPKGEYSAGEDAFLVALREFEEELGLPVPSSGFIHLGDFRQPGGKIVTAWAAEGDVDASQCVSNTFEMEWPRGSGRTIVVPEVDRAQWFDAATAKRKLLKGHVAIVEALADHLRSRHPDPR